jgi:predicted component of type VI protein secretion system
MPDTLPPQDRLQPALLDRLTDDDPDSDEEARDHRVMSRRQLRDAVLRDLAWLFNATRLEGSTPQEILDLPSDFVTRIVGSELVRVRSQTVYYVLTRIKSICKVWLDRQRMAQVA